MKSMRKSHFASRKLIFAYGALAFLFLAGTLRLFAAPEDAASAAIVERSLQSAPSYSKKVPQDVIRLPLQKEPKKVKEEEPSAAESISINAFVFEGNTLFPAEELSRQVASFLRKNVGFAELEEAALTITAYYRKKGYFLANAYLPPQDIRDGKVRIMIEEGRTGEIKIYGNRYFKEVYIRKNLPSFEAGKPIHYDSLVRSLLLMNENTGMKASAAFQKGIDPGTSDIHIQVEEKFPIRAYAHFDNGGSEFVSKERVGSRIEMNNLFIQGDAVALNGVLGSPVENLKFGGAAYRVPVTTFGTSAAFSYSRVNFKSAKILRVLGIEGHSNIYSMGATQALVRTRATRADFRTFFNYKQVRSFTLDERTSNDELRILTPGLSFQHADRFKGKTFMDHEFGIGLPGFMGGLKENDARASREGAGGNFVKYNAELSRVQQMIYASYLITRFSTQLASRTLPATEQMILGGIDSVRGFPQAEHLGDYGYLFNLEIRLPPYFVRELNVPILNKRLEELIQFATFLDHGGIGRKKVLSGESQTASATSLGLGLRFYLPYEMQVSLDWAFPIAGNKPSDSTSSAFYIKADTKIF